MTFRPDTPQALRLAEFEAERPRLLRLGYRMLGSVSEAEDVVQDAWLRWRDVGEGVDSPAAYLTRIVTRLCLGQLQVGPKAAGDLCRCLAARSAGRHDRAGRSPRG